MTKPTSASSVAAIFQSVSEIRSPAESSTFGGRPLTVTLFQLVDGELLDHRLAHCADFIGSDCGHDAWMRMVCDELLGGLQSSNT